jgi:hypothetical protein
MTTTPRELILFVDLAVESRRPPTVDTQTCHVEQSIYLFSLLDIKLYSHIPSS